ncbi:hypothetical protein JKP88DRAFT_247993 [Tribonema minus]|uniref:Uncharacterized protein n=1 Tax=Tribonema minus TaxID=303371 RepID=A0A835YNK8_9STRA|nr:hypothetical protein JKP88DRAFT_247993 [Tribonema minus]
MSAVERQSESGVAGGDGSGKRRKLTIDTPRAAAVDGFESGPCDGGSSSSHRPRELGPARAGMLPTRPCDGGNSDNGAFALAQRIRKELSPTPGPAAQRLHAVLANLHKRAGAQKMWPRPGSNCTSLDARGRWSLKKVQIGLGDSAMCHLCMAAMLKIFGHPRQGNLLGKDVKPSDIALLTADVTAAAGANTSHTCALSGSRVWVLELCAKRVLDDQAQAEYCGSREYMQQCFDAYETFARTAECRRMRDSVLHHHLHAATAAATLTREQQFASQHCFVTVTAARDAAAALRLNSSSSAGDACGAPDTHLLEAEPGLGELVASVRDSAKKFKNAAGQLVDGGIVRGEVMQKPTEGRITGNFFLRINNQQFARAFLVPEVPMLMQDVLGHLQGALRFAASMVDPADDVLVLLGLYASTADLVPAVSYAGAAAGVATRAGYHLRGCSSDLLALLDLLQGAG